MDINEGIFENIIRLRKVGKILPCSNGAIESTISSFSFIKNKFRSKLTNDNSNNLLFDYKLRID